MEFHSQGEAEVIQAMQILSAYMKMYGTLRRISISQKIYLR